MSAYDMGDGTKDVHYREYRLRQIQRLMDDAPEGSTYTVQFKVSGTDLKTHDLNLSVHDMDDITDALNRRADGCRGCAGTCCTGSGSEPCTC